MTRLKCRSKHSMTGLFVLFLFHMPEKSSVTHCSHNRHQRRVSDWTPLPWVLCYRQIQILDPQAPRTTHMGQHRHVATPAVNAANTLASAQRAPSCLHNKQEQTLRKLWLDVGPLVFAELLTAVSTEMS